MKSFNFYRHSLVVKHILMLLAMIFLILGIGFGIVYHSVQTLLIKSIHEKARTICRETINQFDQPFFQCESIAKTFAADLASCPQEQWPKILESTFKSLSFAFDNIDIFSFGEIAITKWENGIPSGSWSAIVHINDQFIPYQDLEDTKCDWVLLFGNNKEGLWYEPSFSRFTKDLIAAYSCPVMQTMPDGSKKMIGAVLISLNASWLHQKASEIQLGKNSNVSLFSTKL